MYVGSQPKRYNHLMRDVPKQIRRQICRVRENSNESNRSNQSAKQTKEDIAAYQKFYVKMNTCDVDLSNSLYSDSTLTSHELEPYRKGYKRSTTPYRTEKYKEEKLRQQMKYQSIVLAPMSFQQQLDRQAYLLKLEQYNQDLRRSIAYLYYKNHQLILTVSRLRYRINYLEYYHRSLEEELMLKIPRAPGPMNADQKGKKLSDLKKMIRETRKMEIYAEKYHFLHEIMILKYKLQSAEQHTNELMEELKFKMMIIRNYETAASLPTAKYHQLNQYIRILKEQLSKRHFQTFLEEENHHLKGRLTIIYQYLHKLHITIRCKEQIFEREKYVLINKHDEKESKTRSNLKELIRLFTKYQQENPRRVDDSPLELSLSFYESF